MESFRARPPSQDLGPAKTKKKADVLSDAVGYIHQSEVDMRHLSDEVNRLNHRIRLLEKLVKCEDCPLVKQMSMMHIQAT